MKYEKHYENFFNEIKDVALFLGWANKKSFIGASELEIKQLEIQKGIRFGEAWLAYLRNFGHKFDIEGIPLYYGLGRMQKAEDTQIEENEALEPEDEEIDWLEEIKQKKLHESISKSINNNSWAPILVDTLLEGGVVKYSLCEDRKLLICNYDIDRKKLGACTPLKTIFRHSFYLKLLHDSTNNQIILNKFPWLNYYKFLNEKFPFQSIPRDRFYSIADHRELLEARIMGINEFEVECIKYLIQEENSPNIPEVFDPYAP